MDCSNLQESWVDELLAKLRSLQRTPRTLLKGQGAVKRADMKDEEDDEEEEEEEGCRG